MLSVTRPAIRSGSISVPRPDHGRGSAAGIIPTTVIDASDRKDIVFRLRFLAASLAVVATAVVLSPAPSQAAARPAAPAAAAAGGTISGTLTTAKGVPVAGVRVFLKSPNPADDFLLPWATTDAAGQYSLPGVPANRYRISFYDPGLEATQWAPRAARETKAAWYTVREGQATVVDESLLPTGHLSVTLLGRNGGGPLSAFCLEAVGDYYLRQGCTTTGTLEIADVRIGTCVLMAQADGETAANPAWATVTEDATAVVAVRQR